MELSGLIFVALALVWAVVLIPKVLRHHDELAETRSVDTVSEDARVVARREAVTPREARLVVGPAPRERRPRAATAHVGDARLRARREAARMAARRRRRVLALLLVIAAGTGAASVAGVLVPWAAAAPGAAVALFLVVARITVRRDNARWAALVAARRAAAPETVEAVEDAEPATVAPEPVAVERNEQGLAVVSGLEDTASIPVVLADLAEDRPGDRLWDPVPVTLPTYVGKPRATRSVRTIDLTAPDVASSGRDPQDSALVAEAATGADGPEQRAVAT